MAQASVSKSGIAQVGFTVALVGCLLSGVAGAVLLLPFFAVVAVFDLWDAVDGWGEEWWFWVWAITFSLTAGGVAAWKNARTQARTIAESAAEQQRAHHDRMVALGDESLTLFTELPLDLRSAEKHLDEAEADFEEGVFTQFWDSIEGAARDIGTFDGKVRRVRSNANGYAETLARYESDPPPFPLAAESVAKLTIALPTADRMKRLVRKAQAHPDFAKIYEMRRTNQILIAGFNSIHEALTQLGDQLADSISNLRTDFRSSMESLRAQLASADDARAAREQQALEIFDNIQRGRKPIL